MKAFDRPVTIHLVLEVVKSPSIKKNLVKKLAF